MFLFNHLFPCVKNEVSDETIVGRKGFLASVKSKRLANLRFLSDQVFPTCPRM